MLQELYIQIVYEYIYILLLYFLFLLFLLQLFIIIIIQTGNDHGITNLILEHVNASINTTVLNGGCLGFGLINIASGDQSLINKCKDIYSSDDAVSGEAAGYSLGLLLCSLGTKSEIYGNIIQDMLAYAHETEVYILLLLFFFFFFFSFSFLLFLHIIIIFIIVQHEKIIRGLSMGVALSLYGNEEDADVIIQNVQLLYLLYIYYR